MAFLNPKDCIPDKTTVINGVTVKEYLLKNHNINNISLPEKRTKKLLGITVHNTADLPKIEDDGRNYTASTVNDNMRTVRVHLYVDDLCAWQNLDWEYQNWSCADGSGNGNTATIAIECIMKSTNDSESLKARDNCARLTAWLLKKYNLTTKDIYTHTYWLHVRDKTAITKTGIKDQICTARHSYKTCPIYIIPKWNEFLDLVNIYLKALGGKVENAGSTPLSPKPSSFKPYKVRVIDPELNIRADAGVQNKVVGVIKDRGAYTIVEEKTVNGSKWGLLKGYSKFKNGWINVEEKYVRKIT